MVLAEKRNFIVFARKRNFVVLRKIKIFCRKKKTEFSPLAGKHNSFGKKFYFCGVGRKPEFYAYVEKHRILRFQKLDFMVLTGKHILLF